ncbi:MAG: hypothetical protein JNJ57_16445, partial [Saprospiraceae bacterium]|nr:hypothetical protein [Saprospiraceae bacterium]
FAGTGAADASGAAAYLSAIWGIPGASGCIFLLTTPPVDTGWQQLEIRLTYDDANSQVIKLDSIFLN